MPGPKPLRRKGFFSRPQASTKLRISVGQLDRLVKKGVLVGEQDQFDHWWFSNANVKAALQYLDSTVKPSRGELTARAFEHFNKGTSDSDIVIDLRITMRELRTLRLEHTPGTWVLPPALVKRLRRAAKGSGVRCNSAADLARSFEHLAAREVKLVELELANA